MEEFYILSESTGDSLTKTEIKKIVRDEFEKQFSKLKQLDNSDVKKIVKDMMVAQYKFFWEKRSFWTNNI
jgi:chemotaxis methyl-accepting protein methylase